jgi:hypothetical protein
MDLRIPGTVITEDCLQVRPRFLPGLHNCRPRRCTICQSNVKPDGCSARYFTCVSSVIKISGWVKFDPLNSCLHSDLIRLEAKSVLTRVRGNLWVYNGL